jgi:hypothetical protein
MAPPHCDFPEQPKVMSVAYGSIKRPYYRNTELVLVTPLLAPSARCWLHVPETEVAVHTRTCFLLWIITPFLDIN